MNRDRHAFALLLALVALTLWRLLAADHANLELYADEAQYWTWSLTPDWGYYSKPPMVAWAIWLGTHLFGDGEMGVRALSALVYPLTSSVLFLLVRRLFRDDPRAGAMAFWAGLVYATLPLVSLGSWLITTDAFLLLFWALSLYVLTFALESGRWRDWLLLGVAVGLGMMSKYSMVFFGLGLAVYLAISSERRRLFLDPRPYGAALVALLFVLPNVLWNANHQFVSFEHTAEISQLDRALFHPAAMLKFFLAQFAVFGPLTFAGLLVLAARPKTWLADDRLRLLAALTLAPLAAFLGLSLLSRAFANWAAFSYASAAALVAVVWVMQGRRRWLIAAVALHLVVAAGIYHAHDISTALGIQLTRKTDPYGRVTGYRALGEEVAKRLQAVPGAKLLGDDRKLFALMRYYARPYSDSACFLNPDGRIDNHYALTADVRHAPEGRFLLVGQGIDAAKLADWFAEVTPQPPIRLPLYPGYAPEYRVWLVRDYRGP
ncbi:MAG: glycosyltransferase family 39 protein [Gallionellaceae bacterium]|nr:glycosyltransferase family 39 protein [Gallionellaceae bacterium]